MRVLEGRHERTQEAEEWCQSESFPKAKIQSVTSRRNHENAKQLQSTLVISPLVTIDL